MDMNWIDEIRDPEPRKRYIYNADDYDPQYGDPYYREHSTRADSLWRLYEESGTSITFDAFADESRQTDYRMETGALRDFFNGSQSALSSYRNPMGGNPLKIYEDMEALVDAVNGSKDHPILKAAGFHAMFENIHPFTDGNGRTGRQILNLMLMAAGYRPVAIKHDAGRSYGKSLEAWQVDGDPKPFISQLVQCVDQEERAVAEIVGRLRENPFSENAIDGIGLEDGPARGRSL